MKKAILLASVLICTMQSSIFAQTNTKVIRPSDVSSGYTYDFDKANELIIDRLLNPTKSNEDVKTITEEKSFPKLNVGQTINADYKKKLGAWIEANPNIIISALKNRKEIVHQY